MRSEQLDKLQGQDLTFLDIEATDLPDDKRIIQLSGYRISADRETISTFNVRFNPQQPLTNEIINLLKLDDDELSHMPLFKDKVDDLMPFLEGAVLISFGSFDKIQLQKEFERLNRELPNEWFDLQHFLKEYSGTEISLKNLYTLTVQNPDSTCQHDALYDALMLRDVYYKVLELPEEEVSKYCKITNLLPRDLYPKHKIFTSKELNNPCKNHPNEQFNPVIIKKLELGYFDLKNRITKEVVRTSYIKNMEYEIWNPRQSETNVYKFTQSFDLSESTYEDFYQPRAERFLNKLVTNCQNRAFFFDNVSRKNISHLLENIYDACGVYYHLTYITLNYVIKLKKRTDDESLSCIDFYNKYLMQEDSRIQAKFTGFRTWKKLP
ncbi:3'-5' exonuclease [Ureaplasma ceti]|uniref:Exonuclease domain-containing protein n=1 Tax=Ureaplasma ceti TaxID=3119530 RepID=A0ABP9U6E7_9BACT